MSLRHRLRLELLRLASNLASTKTPARALPDIPRILIIRPDHIGDFLFLLPALRLLRSAFPQAAITLAIGPWVSSLAALASEADQLEIVRFPGFQREPKGSLISPYIQAATLASRWRNNYDVCLVARKDHWWGAMVAAFSAIPQRFGWSTPETIPFLTSLLGQDDAMHEVVANIKLITEAAKYWGLSFNLNDVSPTTYPLELDPSLEDLAYVTAWLTRNLGTDQRFICAHPGAGAPNKLWPPARYEVALREIKAKTGLDAVITGSRQEADLAERIAGGVPGAIPAPGEFNLGQLAALLQKATLVLGSDSGPLHLATAVGTKTVHIYGPADPRKFGPWSPPEKHRLLHSNVGCQPCGNLQECTNPEGSVCMLSISTGSVIEATLELLG